MNTAISHCLTLGLYTFNDIWKHISTEFRRKLHQWGMNSKWFQAWLWSCSALQAGAEGCRSVWSVALGNAWPTLAGHSSCLAAQPSSPLLSPCLSSGPCSGARDGRQQAGGTSGGTGSYCHWVRGLGLGRWANNGDVNSDDFKYSAVSNTVPSECKTTGTTLISQNTQFWIIGSES